MADLLETKQDGVAILTLNRPEARNALSQPMLAGLLEALPRLAADSTVGAIVVTGAGGAFCAGGDVKGFASNEGGANHGRSPEQAAYALRQSMEVSRWLHDMPKITIAAIPGARPAPASPSRWPAISGSPQRPRRSPRPLQRSACQAILAERISCRSSSASPRRRSSTSSPTSFLARKPSASASSTARSIRPN